MSTPRVLVTKRLPARALARLEAVAEVEVNEGGWLTRDELASRVADKDALVTMFVDPVDATVLGAGSRLKIVATVAVGYNNIDVAAAKAGGVVVTNTPDVLTEATADLTWSIVLAMTRRIVEGDRLVRRGGWKGFAFDFMLGTDLRGKQLGIVGLGRIGRAVAAKARAFGMRVAYTRGTPSPGDEAGAMPLDRLLSTSDVVSLHCPLTPDTTHLIDQAALARMKRSAYLVNASRGPVVDEAALAWALKNRLIAGAGLDVYEHEPTIHADLLGLDNVVLVPHLGSATTETRTAMADLAAQNVVAVLTGGSPLTPVG
jgi:glyoxylate reductase